MADANQSTSSMHWLLGAALLLIGVFVVVALVMVNSQAVNVSTTAQVDNVLPTINSAFVNTVSGTLADNTGGAGGTLTLTAGANTTYYVNGVVNDLNGDADFDHMELVFFRTDVAGGYSCAVDKNDCYKVNPCTLDTAFGTATEAKFICQLDLAYFTDSTSTGGVAPATDFTVAGRIYDEVGFGANSSNKEVGTLLALNIPGAINYGTRALGSSTVIADNQHATHQQYGNDVADVEVSSAAAMTCAVRGTIPVANQKWSLTDVDFTDGAATALNGTPADTNLNVGYRTHETDPNLTNKTLYWNIAIPASGVEGACTGTTVETAIAA